MTKYEAVRAKIVEACPELQELTFGLRFLCGNEIHVLISLGKDGGYTSGIVHGNGKDVWGLQSYQQVFLEEYKDDIIGHPIRLSHVLRAIGKRGHHMRNFSLSVEALSFEYINSGVLVQLDLTKDDLSLQSADTIDFLFKILCK